MTDLVRINHTIFSWNSCSFRIDGIPYKGILNLDYEQKRERKVVYAAQRDGTPLGKTSGKYSVSNFSVTFLRDTWDDVTTYLTAKGLGSYGDAEFNFISQYVEPVPGSLPITMVATGCTIDGHKNSHAEGTDELVVEATIGALALLENGKALYSIIRGVPL